MRIAVAYAEAKRQIVMEFDTEEGITAEQAVQRSGIMVKFPQIDLKVNQVGIFGKLVDANQVLSGGDRVEVYRPALGKPPKKERAEGDAAAARPARPAARTAAAKPAESAAEAAPAVAAAQPAESAPVEAAAAPAAENTTTAAPESAAAAPDEAAARAARTQAAKERTAAARAAKAAKAHSPAE